MASPGYTFVEVVVTISVIGILMSIITVAYPSLRDNQNLILAEQYIQSTLREAQSQAIYESRSEECIESLGDEPEKVCSDAGIFLKDNSIIVFADTIDDNKYSEHDFIINTLVLPSNIKVENETSFLFEGIPPTFKMIVNGLEENDTKNIVIKSGKQKVELVVHRYGYITKEKE